MKHEFVQTSSELEKPKGSPYAGIFGLPPIKPKSLKAYAEEYVVNPIEFLAVDFGKVKETIVQMNKALMYDFEKDCYRERPRRDVAGLLRKMISIVQEGWCKGQVAQDRHGMGVEPLRSSAVRWCIMGAAVRACGGMSGGVDEIWRILSEKVGERIEKWNDLPSTTLSDVCGLLDRTAMAMDRA